MTMFDDCSRNLASSHLWATGTPQAWPRMATWRPSSAGAVRCQVVVDGVLVTGEIFMGFHGICVGFVNLWDFCWTVVGILLELNVFLIELRVNGMEWNGISLDLVGFHWFFEIEWDWMEIIYFDLLEFHRNLLEYSGMLSKFSTTDLSTLIATLNHVVLSIKKDDLGVPLFQETSIYVFSLFIGETLMRHVEGKETRPFTWATKFRRVAGYYGGCLTYFG